MEDYTEHMERSIHQLRAARLRRLTRLRAQVDRELAREAQRAGGDYTRPRSRGVGYVVLDAPTLRDAVHQLAGGEL